MAKISIYKLITLEYQLPNYFKEKSKQTTSIIDDITHKLLQNENILSLALNDKSNTWANGSNKGSKENKGKAQRGGEREK